MGDKPEVKDDVKEKGGESGKEATGAQGEAQSGMKDLADKSKDYSQARKNGVRDKNTQEILGEQPTFVDSSLSANRFQIPSESGGSLEKNAEGRVTKVTYPDGESSSITYDETFDNPTEIKDGKNSSWKLEKDGWNHYKNGKRDQHLDGTIEVSHNGDITVKENTGYSETIHPNGALDKWYPDRSGAFQDKDGNVYSILHKDGSNTFPEYDKNGNPVKFTDLDANGKEKGSWVKDGDRWSIRDKDGKEVSYFHGEVSVNSDGDIVRKGKEMNSDDFETQTVHRDGSITRELKNGSIIETNEKAQLSQVKYPDGKTADFKYDDKGGLSEFTDAKGVIHRNDGGKWQQYQKDKDGNETALGAEEGFYKTTPDGDVEWHSKDDSVVESTHANGKRDRVEYWDRQDHKDVVRQTTWDEKGRLSSASYPGERGQDKVVFFNYDKNGKLDSVSDAHRSERGMHGDHWLKSKDGTWTKFDENGDVIKNPDGSSREAKSIEVKPNGDIIVTNKDGTVDPPIEARKF